AIFRQGSGMLGITTFPFPEISPVARRGQPSRAARRCVPPWQSRRLARPGHLPPEEGIHRELLEAAVQAGDGPSCPPEVAVVLRERPAGIHGGEDVGHGLSRVTLPHHLDGLHQRLADLSRPGRFRILLHDVSPAPGHHWQCPRTKPCSSATRWRILHASRSILTMVTTSSLFTAVLPCRIVS